MQKTDLTHPKAFSQFFQQTHVQLYRYLCGLTGGPAEEVEDLVAETFTRAWSARHRFQGDHQVALRWLLKIARNQTIDSYRRRKSSGEPEPLDSSGAPAPDADPESQVVSEERRQILWGLLQSLPEETREILTLRYMLDWPVGEIAAYLGKGETAVSMTIHRALKRLQQAWPVENIASFTKE